MLNQKKQQRRILDCSKATSTWYWTSSTLKMTDPSRATQLGPVFVKTL